VGEPIESIDPIEYDPAELRELARVRGDRYIADEFLWAELPDSFRSARATDGSTDRSADRSVERDGSAAWTGSLEERQKPYLRRLPDGERARATAREWIEGLVERGGSGGAAEALAYYESIGWLTEAAREELDGYLLAVRYREGGSIDDLTRTDHVESLARTARLAGLADRTDGAASESRTPTEGDGERAGPTVPVREAAAATEENRQTSIRTADASETPAEEEDGTDADEDSGIGFEFDTGPR
jgi:flagellar protein FlaE